MEPSWWVLSSSGVFNTFVSLRIFVGDPAPLLWSILIALIESLSSYLLRPVSCFDRTPGLSPPNALLALSDRYYVAGQSLYVR